MCLNHWVQVTGSGLLVPGRRIGVVEFESVDLHGRRWGRIWLGLVCRIRDAGSQSLDPSCEVCVVKSESAGLSC